METGFLAYTEFTRSTDMSFQPQLLFVLAVLALSETGTVGWTWMKLMLGGLKWRLDRMLYLTYLNNFLFDSPVLAGNAEHAETTAHVSTTTTD